MQSILDQLAERKVELAELQTSDAVDALSEWYGPLIDKAERKLDAVLTANTSRRIKIYMIQSIMSEVRENPTARVACKKGCSNCCHQQVKLSQLEADAIGDRISRRPVTLRPGHKMRRINAYGRDTACTFLLDGACSIYENRPVMCRNYVNADRDNLLCSFENVELMIKNDPRCVYIPMPDAGVLVEACINIGRNTVHGDIRDFFPA
jgi:Fe-S-cluster containining protein